jgi:curved DNA-binding protein CbpA
MSKTEFVDFYELMQISPNAEPETVHRVFRLLAARHHPDNPETGDVEKFLVLQQAHAVLSHPAQRTAYDLRRDAYKLKPLSVFSLRDFAIGVDGESNRRLGVLCLLYNNRRSVPENPGLSLLELETVMAFPREHLMFTLWYLLDKQYVIRDDRSSYMISAEGVDYVESNLSSNQVLYKLLKSAESGGLEREEPRIWHVQGVENAG